MTNFEKMQNIAAMCKAYEDQYKEVLYTGQDHAIEEMASEVFNQIEEFTGEHSDKMVRVRVYNSMQEFVREIEEKKGA